MVCRRETKTIPDNRTDKNCPGPEFTTRIIPGANKYSGPGHASCRMGICRHNGNYQPGRIKITRPDITDEITIRQHCHYDVHIDTTRTKETKTPQTGRFIRTGYLHRFQPDHSTVYSTYCQTMDSWSFRIAVNAHTYDIPVFPIQTLRLRPLYNSIGSTA